MIHLSQSLIGVVYSPYLVSINAASALTEPSQLQCCRVVQPCQAASTTQGASSTYAYFPNI
jgi:hypothetical protein